MFDEILLVDYHKFEENLVQEMIQASLVLMVAWEKNGCVLVQGLRLENRNLTRKGVQETNR